MSVGTARYPAPAVQYPVGRSRKLGMVLALAQLFSLMVLAAWFVQGAGATRSAILPSMLLWLSAAALAARFWTRLPVGILCWDGATWRLSRTAGVSSEQELGVTVVVQLDLQRRMALAFPAARPAMWLLVERQIEPTRWLDLRRAVYSRPSAVSAPASTDTPH